MKFTYSMSYEFLHKPPLTVTGAVEGGSAASSMGLAARKAAGQAKGQTRGLCSCNLVLERVDKVEGEGQPATWTPKRKA